MQRLVALFLAPCALVLTAAGAQRAVAWTDSRAHVPAAAAPVVPPPDWAPPAWLSGQDAAAIASLSKHGPKQGPKLKSRSAIVYDLDADEVLYEKAADFRAPVASMTKVMSAVTLGAATRGGAGGELDREVCIGPEHYPTRSGARSKFNTGDCATGWDYLGSAMVASDNRAAYALASISGLGVDGFVERMNTVAAELGMDDSEWVEPSGIQDENLSTARDMARATLALSSIPGLAPATAAPSWDLHRTGVATRRLFTTNKLVDRRDLDFAVVKTGYTDTARYCVTSLVQTGSGQRLLITLMRAPADSSRWADMRRVLDWVEQQG